MTGILLALAGITFIILIHELGHYISARLCGVGVHEFAIGMGPTVIKHKRNQTIYALRLLPIGGFVRVAGMDGDSVDASIDFYQKSRWARGLILAAGSIMNFVLGFVIFMAVFSQGIPEATKIVSTVVGDMPAAQSGLKPGDEIISINDQVMTTVPDIVATITQSAGQSLAVTIVRDNQTQNVLITPIKNTADQYQIGVQFDKILKPASWPDVIGYSATLTLKNITMSLQSIKSLIQLDVDIRDMIGPVGIVQVVGSREAAIEFFMLVAMISIGLGVFNLLPVPVLDGGHLLLLLIESIRNKRLSPAWESRINQITTALLLALMAVILYHDIIQWGDRAVQFKQ